MKNHARQAYRDFEKLGFLCRWALLAMTATIVLIVSWAGLTGTMAISSNLETTMLIPDAVWRQGTAMPSLHGFLDGPAPHPLIPLFVYQGYFGHLRFTQTNCDRDAVISYLPASGTHRVTLRGLPYGPMAFKQHQAVLTVVPDPETVYLLDARFLAGIERSDKREDKQNAIRITRELARLGQVVLVFPGRRKLLKHLSTELDQYRDIPWVFSLCKGHRELPDVIASIARNLRHRNKTYRGNHRKPYVITGDVKLAIATAGQNHYTHLVGTENTPENLPELIRMHANPKELAEHLAKERPVHLSIP